MAENMESFTTPRRTPRQVIVSRKTDVAAQRRFEANSTSKLYAVRRPISRQ